MHTDVSIQYLYIMPTNHGSYMALVLETQDVTPTLFFLFLTAEAKGLIC